MMKNILYFLLASVLFVQCKFTENYSFNKNWGGNYKATLDMSELMAMGGEEAAQEEEIIPEEEELKLEEEINALKGISNAEVDADNEKGIITFAFDFEDLEALNALQKADIGDEEEGADSPLGMFGTWEMNAKGNTFTFDMVKEAQEEMVSEEESEADQMLEVLQVKTVFNFAKDVKSFEGNGVVQGESSNQLILEYSGKDLVDNKRDWKLEVKF